MQSRRTSATTKFAVDTLSFQWRGEWFTVWFDGNGKITVDNGTFAEPVANSFSLPHIKYCPGSTPICEAECYVHGLQENEPEIYVNYEKNARAIERILADPDLLENAARCFAQWIIRHAPRGFRWHVSGDVFSADYAWFIIAVCRFAPDVPFWIYTRSFTFVPILINASNLVVNLSADANNYEQALAIHKKRGLRICYMTVGGSVPNDLPDGSVIFPSHQLRGRDLPDPKKAPWWRSLNSRQKKMVCPPDFFGQSERLRCGPCKRCLV